MKYYIHTSDIGRLDKPAIINLAMGVLVVENDDMTTCELCGTKITPDDQKAYTYCQECDDSADEMGLEI